MITDSELRSRIARNAARMFTPTPAERDVLCVLRDGGTLWRSNSDTVRGVRAAWACKTGSETPRRVAKRTIRGCEDMGWIVESRNPRTTDVSWTLTDAGRSLVIE